MDRFRQGGKGTARVLFDVDGVLTDADGTVNVSIARADGTSAQASTAAGHDSTGQYSFVLGATHLSLLDWLTLTWTGTFGGTAVTQKTYAQVAGGFLFTLADARARSPMNDASAWPTALVYSLRTQVEDDLERACGVAFVPRYSLETHANPWGPRLRLNWRAVRALRSVSADGVAWDSTALAAQKFVGGRLDSSSSSCYIGGSATVLSVGYEHGLDFAPGAVRAAALDFAAASAASVSETIDPRATRIITQDGELRFGGPSSGVADFGIASVDSVVSRYGEVGVW